MAQQFVTIKEYKEVDNMDQLTLIELRQLIRAIRRAMNGKYRLCLIPVGADPDFFEGIHILQGPLIPSALRKNNGMEPVSINRLKRYIMEDETKHKSIACPYHQLIRELIQVQRLRFLQNISIMQEDEDLEEVPALVRYAKNSLTYHWKRGRKWKGNCDLEINETDFRVKDPRIYVMLAEALTYVQSKNMPLSEIEQGRALLRECTKMSSR